MWGSRIMAMSEGLLWALSLPGFTSIERNSLAPRRRGSFSGQKNWPASMTLLVGRASTASEMAGDQHLAASQMTAAPAMQAKTKPMESILPKEARANLATPAG